MDVPSAGLRADVSHPVFSALSGSGGSWSPHGSDAWNCPADPWSYLTSDPEFSLNVSSPESVSSSSSSSCSSSITDFLPLASALASPSHLVYAEPGGPYSPSPHSSSSSFSSSSSSSGQSYRRLRSKNPSRQRQCASEKEKLRMRDLTKALHRLRTYLPPSVAPEGQALTKIQTLRLAVRYIAHLSAQLEVPGPRGGQASLPQARCPGLEGRKFMHPSRWTAAKLELWQGDLVQPTDRRAQNSTLNSTYEDLLKYTYNTTCEDLLNSSNDSLLQSPQYMEATEARQSYQEYGDRIFHSITPQRWD